MTKGKRPNRSRRTVLQAGLGIIAGSLVVQRATAQGKLAKNVIMYQDHPKDGHQCSMCVNFEPPNACKIVAGDIVPTGWCGAFAPKQT
jgi:hypothetical protein